ncbi:EAL domain-containing protein [Aeromonas hydrophila]|nr:EAL domain-containing protein [Aeromonas hydrophila]KHN52002.1 hypothetical protein OI72_18995 [Aeromonas hydrophila]OFC43010.1 hypothetical protein BA189_22650 [Aeromonas hydrophila]OFC54714.1 hypothetical protein BA188_22640 [Aeromonas hydrophila]
MLFFILLFSCAVFFIRYVFVKELIRESIFSAERAVSQLENMLGHANKSNDATLTLTVEHCDNAVLSLRHQVATVPYIRSVTLISNGNIFCSSLFGAVNYKDLRQAYSMGRLLLMPGNQVRENHPLLILRTNKGTDAVLSTIDGLYLELMLSRYISHNTLLLHVGSNWLNEKGHFFNKKPHLDSIITNEIHSKLYPFSIYSTFTSSSLWRLLWQERKPYIIGVGFILALGTMLIYWLLGRPRTQINELKRALAKNEFIPYFQPLIRSDDKSIAGVEVLLRWQHQSVGFIRPDEFIHQAETCGLIVPITKQLMNTVASIIKPHRHILPNEFHISFNVSAKHCYDESLFYECESFLQCFEKGRITLVLELTEREILMSTPHTIKLFTDLDELGVKIAIDDFGTGHSSLSYLQQFHVDYLKIDQSFIGKIGVDSLSEHLVDNVIDLGRRLSLMMVAEGVETQTQADYLEKKGVHFLQGYLFWKPMSFRDFITLLYRKQ